MSICSIAGCAGGGLSAQSVPRQPLCRGQDRKPVHTPLLAPRRPPCRSLGASACVCGGKRGGRSRCMRWRPSSASKKKKHAPITTQNFSFHDSKTALSILSFTRAIAQTRFLCEWVWVWVCACACLCVCRRVWCSCGRVCVCVCVCVRKRSAVHRFSGKVQVSQPIITCFSSRFRF